MHRDAGVRQEALGGTMKNEADDLAKLTFSERLRVMFGSDYGRKILATMLTTFVAMAVSFVYATYTHTEKPDDRIEVQLQQLTTHTLQPVVESIPVMEAALDSLRLTASQLPNGPAKTDILNSAAVLNTRIVFLKGYTSRMNTREKRSESWSFVSTAHADTGPTSKFTIEDARPYVFIMILLALAFTFCGSVIAIFFVKDPKKLTFAIDTVKTLLGFFIGVVTTFMGVNPRA
jgi:hypothetical protein